MRRFFIELSYNGANYSGWQTQENAVSVQETLMTTMRKVTRQPVEIFGSSRTDAGVHALHQVAQVDFFEPIEDLPQVCFLLNRALPPDIAVLNLFEVKPDVNARFDALARSYCYVICRKKDPFQMGRSLQWQGNLDVILMNEAAKIIEKTIDFESFSKIHTEVNHFECQVEYARWKEEGHLLKFEIKANRFLRGMVRALVGTMFSLGKGQMNLTQFQEIVNARNRKNAGENAPSCGLFLTGVHYNLADIKL